MSIKHESGNRKPDVLPDGLQDILDNSFCELETHKETHSGFSNKSAGSVIKSAKLEACFEYLDRKYISLGPHKYGAGPYEIDFVQLMWPIKVERQSSAQMGGALGLYYPGLNYAVIDDLLYGDKFSEVWVHEAIHRHDGASEQNVRERTKYRLGETYFH